MTAEAVVARMRFGFLSTYPPKLCGLATFSAALETALVKLGHGVDVVAIDDPDDDRDPNRCIGLNVVGRLRNGDPASVANTVKVLSRSDVVIVQHEYGIFGGVDGDEVIKILAGISVPIIVVLHTVPRVPTRHQREVLQMVMDATDHVVVMSRMASDRLLASYGAEPHKVSVIAHGASTAELVSSDHVCPGAGEPSHFLTWGLLGPGKGIEYALEAVARLKDQDIDVRYTVAGVTHPKVLLTHGDDYRSSLIQRSIDWGIAESVCFDDRYRDTKTLTRFIATASAVVLPYDSREQVTSGVLVDAIACGKPAIATAFPHAQELLATGAGIVVGHGNSRELADAMRVVALRRPRYFDMVAEARRIAPNLSWQSVAKQYESLADDGFDSQRRLSSQLLSGSAHR